MREPTEQLIAAYMAAEYRVHGDLPITLRVGAAAPGGWLEVLGCQSATVVTAWNPFSEQLPADENLARQRELVAIVEAAGLRWLPAVGQDPAGQWLAEESACVLDAPLALVYAWLARFGQFAAVRVERGERCRLVWHPEVRGS